MPNIDTPMAILHVVESRHMSGLGSTTALIHIDTAITSTTGNPPVILTLTAKFVPVITSAVPLS